MFTDKKSLKCGKRVIRLCRTKRNILVSSVFYDSVSNVFNSSKTSWTFACNDWKLIKIKRKFCIEIYGFFFMYEKKYFIKYIVLKCLWIITSLAWLQRCYTYMFFFIIFFNVAFRWSYFRNHLLFRRAEQAVDSWRPSTYGYSIVAATSQAAFSVVSCLPTSFISQLIQCSYTDTPFLRSFATKVLI